METISSTGMTLFHKRIFPVIAVAGLAFFFWSAGRNSARNGEFFPFLGAFVVACLLGCVVYWLAIWGLADRVCMSDDTLLVYKHRREVLIPFSDCDQVWYSRSLGPPRITVTLLVETEIGHKFSFVVPYRAWDFLPHPLVESLQWRIDQAVKTN